MKTIARLVALLLIAGCGSPSEAPADSGQADADAGTGVEVGPPPSGSLLHWDLLDPDPSLIPGQGGCYKVADQPTRAGDSICAMLPSAFVTTDDRCSIACTNTGASAAVTLTCGVCTGHYRVSIAP